MYKISLIVSSLAFILVLGYVAFAYKPSGTIQKTETNLPATAIVSSQAGLPLFIDTVKGVFSYPVDPRD